MQAFWMTYKPKEESPESGWPAASMSELVQRFQAAGTATEWWRSTKQPKIGDRVFFFRQGKGPRGIFGIGEVVTGPTERDTHSADDGMKPRVEVRFDSLVDPAVGMLLPLTAIEELPSIGGLIRARQSGCRVPDDLARELEGLMQKFLPVAVDSGAAAAG